MVRRFTVDHLVDRAWSAPAWLRYGCAPSLWWCSTRFSRRLLVPASAGNFRLMTFFPAVILSAWLGGFGPGAHRDPGERDGRGLLAPAARLVPGRQPTRHRRADPVQRRRHPDCGRDRDAAPDATRLAEESNNRAALAAERAQLIELEHRARTAAEASNRAKDEFLAMLAHELRTPLSAIATAAHTLERLHGRDAAMALPIDVIDAAGPSRDQAGRRSARRRSGDGGQDPDHRQPIDLADIIGRSIDALAAARRLERHDLAVHLVPAWVDADADRMEQVIVNLLDQRAQVHAAGRLGHGRARTRACQCRR